MAWKQSNNRGFYYGAGSPWNNDLCWRMHIERELVSLAKCIASKPTYATTNAIGTAGEGRGDKLSVFLHPMKKRAAALSSTLSTRTFGSSVLSDNSTIERSDHGKTVKKLAQILKMEREERKLKEEQFVQLIREEQLSRQMAEEKLKLVESKVEHLTSYLNPQLLDQPPMQPQKAFLRRTRQRV